jgi:hypothetical protein
MNDLKRAYDMLEAKAPRYTKDFAYYDGTQPLIFASQAMKNQFGRDGFKLNENWCGFVITSTLDRLVLNGITSEDETTTNTLKHIWDYQDFNLLSRDVHESALVAGESYIIAWPDENGQPEAYCNDPRLCHIQYDSEHPQRKLWAAKRWVDDDGYMRMTMYYPDHLEYYMSTRPAEQCSTERSLHPMEPPTAPNPYGEIPVFHYRVQRRVIKSDLNDVLALQDGLNKELTDLFVCSEFNAFPQRYIISNAENMDATIKNRPGKIWQLAAAINGDAGSVQSTSVGQFPAADMGGYLQVKANLAETICTLTHTPRHYLLNDGSSNLSGEALIAMEAPLNKKCKDRIDAFSPTWQRLAAFLLKIAGVAAEPKQLVTDWQEPATVQPRTAAEITQIRVASGIPLSSALKMEGMTAAEVAQVEEAKVAEAAARQTELGTALTNAMREFDGS